MIQFKVEIRQYRYRGDRQPAPPATYPPPLEISFFFAGPY